MKIHQSSPLRLKVALNFSVNLHVPLNIKKKLKQFLIICIPDFKFERKFFFLAIGTRM